MKQPKVRVGTAYLMGAQGVFFLSAYALHIVLGRYLGPAEYGLFGVALYAATMIRTFVASGVPMAVTRYISAETGRAEAVFQRGLQLQFGLAVGVSIIFFAASPWLAGLLGDPALTLLFRIVAPITIFFGVFFLINQYYNGLRRYRVQSFWLAVSYLLRAGCAILLAVLGFRVVGAVSGLVVAIAIACVAILITRKPGETKEPFPAPTLITFAIPLILASIGHAFITDLDLMFVKRLVPGDAAAGYYTSAKALAYVMPFSFYALSSALYPAVSNAYAAGDEISLKDYIRKANQLLLAVTLPGAIVIALNSRDIIEFIYGNEYSQAAPVLSWLIIGFSLLAVFLIHKTVITACGFPKISSALTLALLPICVLLQLLIIPVWGLRGAALAASITFLLGVISSSLVIVMKFHAFIGTRSMGRIAVASTLVLAANLLILPLGIHLVLRLAVLGSVYLVALRWLGEWKGSHVREMLNQFFTGQSSNHSE